MCKIGGKARKKDQVMRVLTLICFFHFSGLNNGFAYLADASGAADGAGFAPYFVTGCAKVLNPLNWKRTALDSLRQFGFYRPARVIRHASSRAIKNMLVESTVFQLWFAESCLKMASSGREPMEGAVKPGAVPGQEDAVYGLEHDPSGGNMALSEDGRVMGLKDPMGYFEKDRRQSWIWQRHAVWNELRSGDPAFLDRFLPRWNRLPVESGGAGPPLKARMGEFMEFRPERAVRRLTYSSESGEEDPPVFAASGREVITPNHRGDFFFMGGGPA